MEKRNAAILVTVCISLIVGFLVTMAWVSCINAGNVVLRDNQFETCAWIYLLVVALHLSVSREFLSPFMSWVTSW